MIRVPMTLNEDEMRLITAYNQMKIKTANGKSREMLIRVTNGTLQLYDVRPSPKTDKHIDKS